MASQRETLRERRFVIFKGDAIPVCDGPVMTEREKEMLAWIHKTIAGETKRFIF